MIVKTCFAVNFPKKHPDFKGLETNQGYEIFSFAGQI